MSYIKNNRHEEVVILSDECTCTINNIETTGTLVLSNIRIYCMINGEEKTNDVILDQIKKVRLGGINVLRLELVNGQSLSFIIDHVFKWIKEVKKAIKNY